MNYTLLCDFYELTMGNGYFQTDGYADQICYFDVFFRNVPDGGGFAIAAGLEQVIDYIENLRFTEEDIAYLRGKGCFCEGFLDYLRTFRFTGDLWAVPEGTPIFPGSPSSPSAPPPLRPSSSRPSCCSPSTTSPSSPPRPTASSGPPTAAR